MFIFLQQSICNVMQGNAKMYCAFKIDETLNSIIFSLTWSLNRDIHTLKLVPTCAAFLLFVLISPRVIWIPHRWLRITRYSRIIHCYWCMDYFTNPKAPRNNLNWNRYGDMIFFELCKNVVIACYNTRLMPIINLRYHNANTHNIDLLFEGTQYLTLNFE